MFELTTHGSLDEPAPWARLSDGSPQARLTISEIGRSRRQLDAEELLILRKVPPSGALPIVPALDTGAVGS
jgi:hypothetical protein